MTYNSCSSTFSGYGNITGCEIDSTHHLIVYQTTTPDLRCVVATLTDSSVTLGKTLILSDSSYPCSLAPSVIKLTDTTFCVLLPQPQNNKIIKTFTLTLSETTLTAGSVNNTNTSNNINSAAITRLDNSIKNGQTYNYGFVAWMESYYDSYNYPYNTYCYWKIGYINGNNSINGISTWTSGTNDSVISTSFPPTITVLDKDGSTSTSRILITYLKNTGGRYAKVATFNWSTNAFSFSSETQLYSSSEGDSNGYTKDVKRLSSTKVLVSFITSSGVAKWQIVNISGTTITPCTIQTSTLSRSTTYICSVAVKSSTTWELIYKATTTPFEFKHVGITWASDTSSSLDTEVSETAFYGAKLEAFGGSPYIGILAYKDYPDYYDKYYWASAAPPPTKNVTSSTSLDVSGSITHSFKRTYTTPSSTTIDISGEITSTATFDREVTSSTTLDLSGSITTEVVYNRAVNSITTIPLSVNMNSYFDNFVYSVRGYPHEVGYTKLDANIISLSTTKKLVAYTTGITSGYISYYVREIDTTDRLNPTYGTEYLLTGRLDIDYCFDILQLGSNFVTIVKKDGYHKLMKFSGSSGSYEYIGLSSTTLSIQERINNYNAQVLFPINSTKFGVITDTGLSVYAISDLSLVTSQTENVETMTKILGTTNIQLVKTYNDGYAKCTEMGFNDSNNTWSYADSGKTIRTVNPSFIDAVVQGSYIYFLTQSNGTLYFDRAPFSTSLGSIDTNYKKSVSGTTRRRKFQYIDSDRFYVPRVMTSNYDVYTYSTNSITTYSDNLSKYVSYANVVQLGSSNLATVYTTANDFIYYMIGLNLDNLKIATGSINLSGSITSGIGQENYTTNSSTSISISGSVTSEVSKRYFSTISSTPIYVNTLTTTGISKKNYTISSSTTIPFTINEDSEYKRNYVVDSSPTIPFTANINASIGYTNYDAISSTSLDLSSNISTSYDRIYTENASGDLLVSGSIISATQQAFTTRVLGSLDLTSTIESSTPKKDYSITSSSDIGLSVHASTDSKANFDATVSAEIEISSSIVTNFMRNYLASSSTLVTITSDINSKYQDFQNYQASVSTTLSLDSDIIYDFIKSWSTIASDVINIDAVAESIWTSIQENKTSGSVDLLADIDSWKRDYRFMWSADVSGTAFVTGYINSNTDAISQIVYLNTPIQLEHTMNNAITLENEMETKITSEIIMNLTLLNQVYEEK